MWLTVLIQSCAAQLIVHSSACAGATHGRLGKREEKKREKENAANISRRQNKICARRLENLLTFRLPAPGSHVINAGAFPHGYTVAVAL